MADEEVTLQQVDEKVTLLLEESRAYYKLGNEAFAEMYQMSATIEGIARTNEHLQKMPDLFTKVVDGLENLFQMGADIRRDLIRPATSKDQMDIKAVYMIMGFSVFMVLLLGTVIIVDRITGNKITVEGSTPIASFKVQGSTDPKKEEPQEEIPKQKDSFNTFRDTGVAVFIRGQVSI